MTFHMYAEPVICMYIVYIYWCLNTFCINFQFTLPSVIIVHVLSYV